MTQNEITQMFLNIKRTDAYTAHFVMEGMIEKAISVDDKELSKELCSELSKIIKETGRDDLIKIRRLVFADKKELENTQLIAIKKGSCDWNYQSSIKSYDCLIKKLDKELKKHQSLSM